MPRYIQMLKLTQQGITALKDSPKRADDYRKMVEKAGGKTQLFYTLGEYDAVALTEVPDDESILRLDLELSRLGNVRTTTLKAWSLEEASRVISQLS